MTIQLDASQHLVKAVTVFSSRKAEVIRTFQVELAEGQNELFITALPSCIDTESARITGLGDAVLFDVVCTVEDARDAPPNSDGDALKVLERRRGVLEGEKALRGCAADILVEHGHTLSAEYTTASTVEAYLDSLLQRGSSILEQAEAIDAQLADVDKEIEKEKRRLQKERLKAAARGRVSAVIMAKRSGGAEITLTYMVSNATWSPSYDLRATTEDGKPSGTVTLHYRASIQQNTGEDWRNTAVSVSTATPGLWTNIPALRSLKISPGAAVSALNRQMNLLKGAAMKPGVQQSQANAFSFGPLVQTNNAPGVNPSATAIGAAQTNRYTGASLSGAAFRGSSNASTTAAVPAPNDENAVDGGDGWTSIETQTTADSELLDKKDVQWTETKAVVTESAVSSSFRIEGNCTIPSEPNAHKVAIALLTFDAKVIYVAVPRSAPVAFLQCEVKNTSEYRLLPGPVNVFLDNSPVSRTSINDVSPEEVFKCTLGPDPSLRIKCARLPRTVSSSGSAYAAQTTVTTYKLCTTVYNGHGFTVKGLQVRDTAPDPCQPAEKDKGAGIKVVIKRPQGLGEAEPDKLIGVVCSPKNSSVHVRWGRGESHKEGKYVWIVDVGSGEEVKLEAEYEIRAPADYVWHLKEEFFR